MITIIYPYRNREPERIKRSLDSLDKQSSRNFSVVFVDYGSNEKIATQIKKIVSSYSFASYHYLFTEHQPWNKSKALNFWIKNANTDYCFVADVDMIFDINFVSFLKQNCIPSEIIYFKVGYLSKEESVKSTEFGNYKIKFYSTEEATGMSLFPVKKLQEVQGFDEFFHFWGSEDTDIHNRLKNIGCKIIYFDEKIMLLHQWHVNYRNRETSTLNSELQLNGIVELNSLHLANNLKEKVTAVNSETWGSCISQSDFEMLTNFPVILITNEKREIDYFLYNKLAQVKNQVIAIQIKKDPIEDTFKYKVKRLLRKKVPKFYDLKTINDLLLQHIVSFYHQKPYVIKITDDFESIIFKIKI